MILVTEVMMEENKSMALVSFVSEMKGGVTVAFNSELLERNAL